MSIFHVDDAPCGPFVPLVGDGAQLLVSFARPASVNLRRIPTQNAAGEVLLSYAAIGSISIEMQPRQAGFPRYVGGQIVEVAYVGFVPGNADLRPGDRCYLSALQLEIVNVMHYGTEHTEIEFKQIGR